MTIMSILLTSILLTACSQTTEEEAIRITRDFVNENVKFYVNEDEETPIVQRAMITIMNTEKINDNWNIYLNIKSNHTGELKQTNQVITVDGKNGEVIGMKKIEINK